MRTLLTWKLPKLLAARSVDAALEGEAEDEQPIGVAACRGRP